MDVERQNQTLRGVGHADAGADVNRSGTGEVPQASAAVQDERALARNVMEAVVEPSNLNRAYRRVKANRGSPGVDGMSVDQLGDWCRANKHELIESLLAGRYRPQPIRGAEIPKLGGGSRQLGIPTVADRLVQQALLQVLEPILEPHFSERSYGFRPGRSAHQGLRQGQTYVAEGRAVVVDIDLEKFFDRVNHDVLMTRLVRHVGDVRVLRGRAEVLGRDFEVQRDSRVTFGGPAKRPFVNVTAVHVNQREDVTVFMTVRGEGKDLTFKPSSLPALAESEIYTLLATGRRTLKRGSGASMSGADAASILGSLAATQLRSTITNILPLDVLSIESGGGEGLSGTRLEVGTYLSDKAYLGGEVRIGADPRKGENRYGFRFEYQFTPRLSLQTEYGDAMSGGADLIWSREY